MILCIGEILADMIGEEENGTTVYKQYCGGAAFNVAVNAKQAGASVGFIGRVGKDPVGKFLFGYAQKSGLNFLSVQKDEKRNTTLALVSLTDGERDFSFFRHDTADFHIDGRAVRLADFADLTIVHLGSLMLSEKKGRALAIQIANKTKKAKKLLSFDVNFRMDLYHGLQEAIDAYRPIVNKADILKFSEDEILAYTGARDLETAIEKMQKKDRLLLITLGSKGSRYVYNGQSTLVATEKICPIDTTGAGDAFFGTVLACLENKNFTKENIERALLKGNQAGARTTQFKGAIRL